MDKKIEFPEWTIIAVVRYTLGRITYVVSDTCDLVINNWDKFSENIQYAIRQDVEEAFERYEKRLGGLGMDMDVKAWKKVRMLWNK